jgi:endogenous inhibitor of DNA gyrase (YacG/DUF329 family)
MCSDCWCEMRRSVELLPCPSCFTTTEGPLVPFGHKRGQDAELSAYAREEKCLLLTGIEAHSSRLQHNHYTDWTM